MFVCAPDDGEAPRRAGCLCHTPAFARLNAHLAQKFSRSSSHAAIGRYARRVRRGIGEHGRRRHGGAQASRIAFTNLRLFDGKSDALLAGLRVVVDGKTIKAVEPAESPARPRRPRHRLRRPGSDAGPHRRALARDDGVAADRPSC